MEWSQWLQGGPFLEVSFLLELKEEKTKTVQDIINNLSKVTNEIEVVDENVDEIIDFFNRGYPYDEEDSQTINLHSLRLRLYVYLLRKRKAILQLEVVSPNALMVNFWFYGDGNDEPEYDQVGIMKEEFIGFTSFLQELYSIYEFIIGGIAFEEDVLKLFGFEKTYPNECFRYENASPTHFLKEPSSFINIIWNEKYEKLSHIPYNYQRLDKEGILIETSDFNV